MPANSEPPPFIQLWPDHSLHQMIEQGRSQLLDNQGLTLQPYSNTNSLMLPLPNNHRGHGSDSYPTYTFNSVVAPLGVPRSET
jgi:hypothetical protein